MKIVIVHPHGNQNTLKTVKSLNNLNLLDSFWTTIAFPNKFNFFKKKIYEVDYKNIKLIFFKEILRKLCIFFRLKKFYENDTDIFSTHSVYKDIDFKASNYLYLQKKNKKKISAVYSYEDCALNIFREAKRQGIKTFYDLTSPYWLFKKKILDEDLEFNPEWNLSSSELMSKEKCDDKDKEILLSDKIIVASSISAKSLGMNSKTALKEVKILPYGIDPPLVKNIYKRKENEKLKILFVGRPVISKGIHYLTQILNQLECPWELEIAGSIMERPEQISQKLYEFVNDDRCKFLGQISYNEVINKMKKSHVFLFPTLFEGFGQVILEAMSNGLPVITTTNTCGSDIIDNEINGFLTKIRDVETSKNILQNLYENEDLRLSIAEESYNNSLNYSWENYEINLKKFIKINL